MKVLSGNVGACVCASTGVSEAAVGMYLKPYTNRSDWFLKLLLPVQLDPEERHRICVFGLSRSRTVHSGKELDCTLPWTHKLGNSSQPVCPVPGRGPHSGKEVDRKAGCAHKVGDSFRAVCPVPGRTLHSVREVERIGSWRAVRGITRDVLVCEIRMTLWCERNRGVRGVKT